MNAKRRNKLLGIISLIVLLGIAASLILYALKQNINLFYTPTQLLQATLSPDQNIRIGGYVKKQSVQYAANGELVNFVVTDRTHDLAVQYHGVLPNLFREGQTVVVTGKLNKNILIANQVLAKHDERYMPKPLANVLKKGEQHDS